MEVTTWSSINNREFVISFTTSNIRPIRKDIRIKISIPNKYITTSFLTTFTSAYKPSFTIVVNKNTYINIKQFFIRTLFILNGTRTFLFTPINTTIITFTFLVGSLIGLMDILPTFLTTSLSFIIFSNIITAPFRTF